MLRKENGITMITLVVTIIVTMILAAVSITYIAGEDNFLEQAERLLILQGLLEFKICFNIM